MGPTLEGIAPHTARYGDDHLKQSAIRYGSFPLPYNFLQRDYALRAIMTAVANPAAREPGPSVG
jgi:hypothetical protein